MIFPAVRLYEIILGRVSIEKNEARVDLKQITKYFSSNMVQQRVEIQDMQSYGEPRTSPEKQKENSLMDLGEAVVKKSPLEKNWKFKV